VWLYKDQSGKTFDRFLEAVSKPAMRPVVNKKPNPKLLEMWEEFQFSSPETGRDLTDAFQKQAQSKALERQQKWSR